MSRNAFADLEREVILRNQQNEVSRDERARSIDKVAFEEAQKEAFAAALRTAREVEGPSALILAHRRIAELEMARDAVARDIYEWARDLQAYFPGASTMHDVYKGIENMEARIKELESKA